MMRWTNEFLRPAAQVLRVVWLELDAVDEVPRRGDVTNLVCCS